MEKSLTPKQQCFVDEYLVDLNATQAAIRAGYSKKTANAIATENLAKPVIAAAIAAARAARSEATKIDAEWVLRRLAAEVEADVADLYADDGGLKPVQEWPLVWRQGLVAGLDVDETFVDGEKVGQVTKVKLSERVRRLELIGKHIDIGAFVDRKEIGGIGGGPIQVEASIMQAARSSRVALACCATDVPHDPFRGLFRWPGFLTHLRSLMATMTQNSSVVQ